MTSVDLADKALTGMPFQAAVSGVLAMIRAIEVSALSRFAHDQPNSEAQYLSFVQKTAQNVETLKELTTHITVLREAILEPLADPRYVRCATELNDRVVRLIACVETPPRSRRFTDPTRSAI